MEEKKESKGGNVEETVIGINDNNNDPKEVYEWSYEHDELLANWSDKAKCYTLMHDSTQRKFSSINMKLGIPVIVLSTVSGTANFGISTIFPAGFNYGNAVIGTLSLITGVISTISNFLGYAQSEEAHRIASIQWAKFQRTIETELSLNPRERKNPTEFIKYCKAELDRLMEQSPIIPQDIIAKFIRTFEKINNVSMPDICNRLDKTNIYIPRSFGNSKAGVEDQINLLLSAKTNSDNDNKTEKKIMNSIKNKLKSFTNSPNINNLNISPTYVKPANIKVNNSSDSEESVVIKVEEDNMNIINYSNNENKNLEIRSPRKSETKSPENSANKNEVNKETKIDPKNVFFEKNKALLMKINHNKLF